MKLYEKTLKNVLHHHVIPTDENRCNKLISYFQPLKLSSFFSTLPRKPGVEKAVVGYLFSCTQASCNAGVCVNTTCVLRRRGIQHWYTASTICKHFTIKHVLADVPADYLDNFTILHSMSRTDELRITEAILI